MQGEQKEREFLVVVTPDKRVIDEFMCQPNNNWRKYDVIWIHDEYSLNKVRGMKLKWENVHFLHRSYEIENAKEIILSQVVDYPAKLNQLKEGK